MVIRPNRSLTPLGAILFLAGFCAFLLVIVAGFVWAGAWLILPFAGLELVLVAGLCRWMYQHRDDREEIEIDSEHITIIKHNGSRETQCRFQRYWVRISLESGAHPWYPSRLIIGSHGRSLEIAAAVTEDVRKRLYKKLQGRLA